MHAEEATLVANGLWIGAVTTAENGMRALEYLGIRDDQPGESSASATVSSSFCLSWKKNSAAEEAEIIMRVTGARSCAE